jgi:hypothetical protein
MSKRFHPVVELSHTVRVLGVGEHHGPTIVKMFDKVGVLQFGLGSVLHNPNVTQD